MVLRDDSPGTAFAFCVVAYAVVRSVLEFARGDADLRWWLGLSVPQLQGLASSCVVVVLESAGHLPHSWIHTAAAGRLVVVLAIAVALSLIPRYAVLSARHLREVAWALVAMQADRDTPTRARTSLGVMLSRSRYHDGDRQPRGQRRLVETSTADVGWLSSVLRGHRDSQPKSGRLEVNQPGV